MKYLLSGTALLSIILMEGSSYAADVDGVLATIDKFHAALTALDVTKMEPLWVHDDTVMDKEPFDKTITLGWEGTRRNFVGLFDSSSKIKVMQSDGPHVQVQGNVAWALGITSAMRQPKTGPAAEFSVFETDVLKKQSDGSWLYVAHAASLLPQVPTPSEPCRLSPTGGWARPQIAAAYQPS